MGAELPAAWQSFVATLSKMIAEVIEFLNDPVADIERIINSAHDPVPCAVPFALGVTLATTIALWNLRAHTPHHKCVKRADLALDLGAAAFVLAAVFAVDLLCRYFGQSHTVTETAKAACNCVGPHKAIELSWGMIVVPGMCLAYIRVVRFWLVDLQERQIDESWDTPIATFAVMVGVVVLATAAIFVAA